MFAISNIISHIIITSIYHESFQPTFMNLRNNNMTFLRTKNLWEKNIIKRQTTINYDVLQEDQDENNNDVSDDEISLISSEQFSPTQFSEFCNNLAANSVTTNTSDENEQRLDESNEIESIVNKKAGINEPQELNSILQKQIDSSSEPGPSNCSHLEPQIPLEKVIIKRNLGILLNDKETTVFRAIKKWNPNFKQEQVTLRHLGKTKKGAILYQIRAKKIVLLFIQEYCTFNLI